ncbi:MAG: metallophosphoesterase [Bacteroidales bacterium]|nr:metallophosphoesterase [Bacteroidales bacterium]
MDSIPGKIKPNHSTPLSMRPYQLAVFLTVVLVVYSALNYLIYSRAMASIPIGNSIRTYFPWIFLVLASSYIIARFLERIWLSPVSDTFHWLGAIWLGLMIHFLMALLVIDIIRLINWIIPFYPDFMVKDPVQTRFWILKGVVILVGGVAIAGFINAVNPRVNELTIKINKIVGSRKELTIVLASDIHMGTLVGPKRTLKMVNRINALKPDLILFAGDMVDEDLAPVIRHDLGISLSQLKAPLGVYAITGNHEYIGGAEKAVKYLEAHNIKLLRDTAVLVDQSFYLAGRDDRDKPRFSGKERKSISQILNGIDASKPIIMMDHQPFKLDDVAKAGVDLQLSGHTHHGQLWPFNFITKAIYEVSWGYKQKGNSHFYVSSGYGGWGPPMRTGNRPELVKIHLKFD